MNRFVKFTDSQGKHCYINVDHIHAVTVSNDTKRSGSIVMFELGSSIEVQESPERVVCRCKNVGQVSTTEPAFAY